MMIFLWGETETSLLFTELSYELLFLSTGLSCLSNHNHLHTFTSLSISCDQRASHIVLSVFVVLLAYTDLRYSSPTRSGSRRMLSQMSALTSLVTLKPGSGDAGRRAYTFSSLASSRTILHTTKDLIVSAVNLYSLRSTAERRGRICKEFVACLSEMGSRFRSADIFTILIL